MAWEHAPEPQLTEQKQKKKNRYLHSTYEHKQNRTNKPQEKEPEAAPHASQSGGWREGSSNAKSSRKSLRGQKTTKRY